MPDADWLVDYASSFPITAKMTSGLGGATSHIVQSVGRGWCCTCGICFSIGYTANVKMKKRRRKILKNYSMHLHELKMWSFIKP